MNDSNMSDIIRSDACKIVRIILSYETMSSRGKPLYKMPRVIILLCRGMLLKLRNTPSSLRAA